MNLSLLMKVGTSLQSAAAVSLSCRYRGLNDLFCCIYRNTYSPNASGCRWTLGFPRRRILYSYECGLLLVQSARVVRQTDECRI